MERLLFLFLVFITVRRNLLCFSVLLLQFPGGGRVAGHKLLGTVAMGSSPSQLLS